MCTLKEQYLHYKITSDHNLVHVASGIYYRKDLFVVSPPYFDFKEGMITYASKGVKHSLEGIQALMLIISFSAEPCFNYYSLIFCSKRLKNQVAELLFYFGPRNGSIPGKIEVSMGFHAIKPNICHYDVFVFFFCFLCTQIIFNIFCFILGIIKHISLLSKMQIMKKELQQMKESLHVKFKKDLHKRSNWGLGFLAWRPLWRKLVALVIINAHDN